MLYEKLTFTQKVYFCTLCKDGKTIQPYCRADIKLAATSDLVHRIYSELIACKAIIISPESDLDAFDIDAKNFPQKYDAEKVTYHINVACTETNVSILDRINNPGLAYDGIEAEQYNLWIEIALGECIEYLQYRLQKVGFSFSPGPKTRSVFLKLLKNFSVSQIYYIIWCKVNDAARWYLEEKVSKLQAANSVIGACERYGENALYYGRDLPMYFKPYDCPTSRLTKFFYNNVLNMDQEANNLCPHNIGNL